MPYKTKNAIPEPRNIEELKHAIQFGPVHDGSLEYHHNGTEGEMKPGDLDCWEVAIRISNDDVISIVKRCHYIKTVLGYKHYSLDIKYEDTYFTGSFEEFKNSPWWDKTLERYNGYFQDLSPFADLEKYVFVDEDSISVEEAPIYHRTNDWLGNRNNRYEGIGTIGFEADLKYGTVTLAAFDSLGFGTYVHDVSLENLVTYLELIKLIEDKTLKIDLNEDEVTLATKTASVCFKLKEEQ